MSTHEMSHCFVCPKLMFNLNKVLTSIPKEIMKINVNNLYLWLETFLLISSLLGMMPNDLTAIIALISKF